MSRIFAFALCGSMLLTSTAALAQSCPATAREAVRALSPKVGSLNVSEDIHTPRGLTMLGQNVPYAIVEVDRERGSDGFGRVGQVVYRLGRLFKGSSDRVWPAALQRAFVAAYPDADCARNSEWRCSKSVGDDETVGALINAELDHPVLYVGSDSTGGGIDLLRADRARDGDPAYLVCSYRR